MQILYKICLVLLIAGGVNWGLWGLFQFDLVAWLLGGSTALAARVVYVLIGAASLCAVPVLFIPRSGE